MVRSSITAPIKEGGMACDIDHDMFRRIGARPKQKRNEPPGHPCWEPLELKMVLVDPSLIWYQRLDSPTYHCSKKRDSSGKWAYSSSRNPCLSQELKAFFPSKRHTDAWGWLCRYKLVAVCTDSMPVTAAIPYWNIPTASFHFFVHDCNPLSNNSSKNIR